jgi:hypothetical protein
VRFGGNGAYACLSLRAGFARARGDAHGDDDCGLATIELTTAPLDVARRGSSHAGRRAHDQQLTRHGLARIVERALLRCSAACAIGLCARVYALNVMRQ